MITILAALIAVATATQPTKPVAAIVAAPIGIVETSGTRPVRHRITIISAFSCPYCRVLDQQGMAEIRTYWLPRGLSLETIPFILSPTDLATSIAATCGPRSGYARRSTILFRAQPEILGNWGASPEKARSQASSMPDGRGAPEIARLSGVTTLAPSLGLSQAQLLSCLNNPAMQRMPTKTQRAADARWKITGTPTVLIDGKRIAGTWIEIRRALVAAMAS